MKRAEWRHICGSTGCLESCLTIPIYFLNQREVVLLDSGFADRDRGALDTFLEERAVRVRAIIGSHSHNDHNGNHAYYQRTHGAEVILRDVEAALVSDFALMTAAYGPGTAEDMRRELPHLLVKADRTFSEADREISVDNRAFGLIPLPGHTPGHTGIVTPDGVFYVGDAVMSLDVIHGAKLPTAMDWKQDIESKRKLEDLRYGKYVLAHKGVYDAITLLVEENIADRLRRAEQIGGWLAEGTCWTENQAEQLLWEKLKLHSRSFATQTVFRRNVHCALEYLVCSGRAARMFRDGTVWYAVNERSITGSCGAK